MSVIEDSFGQFEGRSESPIANAWSQHAFSEVFSDKMYSNASRRDDSPRWLGNLILEDSSNANAAGQTGESAGPQVAKAVPQVEGAESAEHKPQAYGRGEGTRTDHRGNTLPGSDANEPRENFPTYSSKPKTSVDLEQTHSPKEQQVSDVLKKAADQVQTRSVDIESTSTKSFHIPTAEEIRARQIERAQQALAEAAKRLPPRDKNAQPQESPFKGRTPAENPNPGTDNTPPEEPPHETKPPVQPSGYESGNPILNG